MRPCRVRQVHFSGAAILRLSPRQSCGDDCQPFSAAKEARPGASDARPEDGSPLMSPDLEGGSHAKGPPHPRARGRSSCPCPSPGQRKSPRRSEYCERGSGKRRQGCCSLSGCPAVSSGAAGTHGADLRWRSATPARWRRVASFSPNRAAAPLTSEQTTDDEQPSNGSPAAPRRTGRSSRPRPRPPSATSARTAASSRNPRHEAGSQCTCAPSLAATTGSQRWPMSSCSASRVMGRSTRLALAARTSGGVPTGDVLQSAPRHPSARKTPAGRKNPRGACAGSGLEIASQKAPRLARRTRSVRRLSA
jgi:hypothetical protein